MIGFCGSQRHCWSGKLFYNSWQVSQPLYSQLTHAHKHTFASSVYNMYCIFHKGKSNTQIVTLYIIMILLKSGYTIITGASSWGAGCQIKRTLLVTKIVAGGIYRNSQWGICVKYRWHEEKKPPGMLMHSEEKRPTFHFPMWVFKYFRYSHIAPGRVTLNKAAKKQT